MASVKTCTICFGIGPSASWDKSWRQLPGLSSQYTQGTKTGGKDRGKDRGQSQKPILGRNSGTDLARMHCSNYSLGIIRAASGTTIFELCKSDILQIKHPPNQHLQTKRPPNQLLQINSSKSSILQIKHPPNQASSKSSILQIKHPPNQASSKSSILQIKHPPNHTSSLHPIIIWPFPSRGS
jgi:hypothetical protein